MLDQKLYKRSTIQDDSLSIELARGDPNAKTTCLIRPVSCSISTIYIILSSSLIQYPSIHLIWLVSTPIDPSFGFSHHLFGRSLSVLMESWPFDVDMFPSFVHSFLYIYPTLPSVVIVYIYIYTICLNPYKYCLLSLYYHKQTLHIILRKICCLELSTSPSTHAEIYMTMRVAQPLPTF
jgi:hypothetical protein